MKQLPPLLRNPISWLVVFLLVFSVYQNWKDGRPGSIVRSDGRGYYAYLPALLLYNDGTFSQSVAAEQRISGDHSSPLYLFRDNQGRVNNKFFPGVSVMQTPFFLLACAVSWIAGAPIDGYSPIFMVCFYIGSLFYLFAGLFVFLRVLQRLFPEQQRTVRWVVTVGYMATCLVFYSTVTPSFSHLYSFFLFGVFALLVLKLREALTARRLLFTGITLGLIFLLRPTNLTVVLMVPFLLGSAAETKRVFFGLFRPISRFFLLSAGFVACAFLLLCSWKWQTGSWLVWSYNGEGLNLLRPQLFSCLFSFRTGLFLHTPLLLVALAGALLLFLHNRFLAAWWLAYAAVNCWIISAWWCWDYESPFGNRPYTEHFFFLLIPVVTVAIRYRKMAVPMLAIPALVGLIRLGENRTGFMGDQRFTRHNYFASLQFWKPENYDRWCFTRSCTPFGDRLSEVMLLSDPVGHTIQPADEFSFGVDVPLPAITAGQRYYYTVSLEKQLNDPPLGDVFLVIDAWSKTNPNKRYYNATRLCNDRFEGRNAWTPLVFEGQIYDFLKEYDAVKIYVWNPAKQVLSLRNVRVSLAIYGKNH